MTKKPKLGENIRAARKAKDWSQVELGERIGHVDGAQVSRWETGAEGVGRENLENLARVLGKSTDWLLGIEREQGEPDESLTGVIHRLVVRYRTLAASGAGAETVRVVRQTIESELPRIVPSATEAQILALASIFLDPIDRSTQGGQESEQNNHLKRG